MSDAAPLRLVAVGALEHGLAPIAAEFSRRRGTPTDCTFTAPAMLAKLVAEGGFDVIVASVPAVEALDRAGGLHASSRVRAGRVGIGLAIRVDLPRPDIATREAFTSTIKGARNIVFTDPTIPNGSGALTRRILGDAGLVEIVLAKGRQEGLRPARELIAKGEVDMGLFYVSEATIPGVALIGPVPAPLQHYTEYEGAVLAKSGQKSLAAEFLAFAIGSAVTALWRAANIDAP